MKAMSDRKAFPIHAMCRALEVSRSGYYAWLGRPESARSQRNARLSVAIRAAHQASRQSYGTRRIHTELQAQGWQAGRDRIGRLRRQMGLHCRQARRFRPCTTDSDHDLAVAPNRLAQCFKADRPHQVWLSDITYIGTDEGFVYLAAIKDLYPCEIVGYAMSERIDEALTLLALRSAYERHRPAPGLILHSDRGSQYCARQYRKTAREMGMLASMSRRANCWDNAPMESFWSSLKTEKTHHERYATRAQAVSAIREWIEIFYHRCRRHSRLGYQTPAFFASQYRTRQQQAA